MILAAVCHVLRSFWPLILAPFVSDCGSSGGGNGTLSLEGRARCQRGLSPSAAGCANSLNQLQSCHWAQGVLSLLLRWCQSLQPEFPSQSGSAGPCSGEISLCVLAAQSPEGDAGRDKGVAPLTRAHPPLLQHLGCFDPLINLRHSILQALLAAQLLLFLPKGREGGTKPLQEEGRIKPQQGKPRRKRQFLLNEYHWDITPASSCPCPLDLCRAMGLNLGFLLFLPCAVLVFSDRVQPHHSRVSCVLKLAHRRRN